MPQLRDADLEYVGPNACEFSPIREGPKFHSNAELWMGELYKLILNQDF